MGRLIVHVGYPKCASTFLQRWMLPLQPEIRLLHDREVADALSLADFPGGEAARAGVLDDIARQVEGSPLPTVISCEHFCMPGSWLETRERTRRARLSRPEITDLLRRHLPVSAILMIVRNQSNWIPSWYQERVKRYETRSLSSLLGSSLFRDDIAPALHYATVADAYRERFGRDSLQVLPFELLQSDPQRFVGAVFAALGIAGQDVCSQPFNPGMSSPGIALRRRSNHLLRLVPPRHSRVDAALFRASKRLYAQDWVLARLFGRYRPQIVLSADLEASLAADNQRLQAAIALPLAELGYPLPVPASRSTAVAAAGGRQAAADVATPVPANEEAA